MAESRTTNRLATKKARQPLCRAREWREIRQLIYRELLTQPLQTNDSLFITRRPASDSCAYIAANPTPINVTTTYQPITIAAEVPFLALLIQVKPITISISVQIVNTSMDDASL